MSRDGLASAWSGLKQARRCRSSGPIPPLEDRPGALAFRAGPCVASPERRRPGRAQARRRGQGFLVSMRFSSANRSLLVERTMVLSPPMIFR